MKYLKYDASKWGRELFLGWESFEDFEAAFKRKYWNRMVQRKFENELMGEGNYVQGKTDLSTYIFNYYEKAQYLDNKPDMSQFLQDIARQFPNWLGCFLITAQDVNMKQDLEMLVGKLAFNDGGKYVNKVTEKKNGPEVYHKPTYNYNNRENNNGYRTNYSQGQRNKNARTSKKIR